MMFSSEWERARMESCIHQFCCHFSHPKTISQGIVSLSLHGPITLSLSQYLFLAYVYETVACPGFPFPKTKVKHYFLERLRNASSLPLISKSKSGNGTRSLIRSLKWHHSIFWSMQIRARSFSADKRTSRKNNFLFLLPVNLFRQAFRFVRKFDRAQSHIFTIRSICLR